MILFEPQKWKKSGPDAQGCDIYKAKDDGVLVTVKDTTGGEEVLKATKGLNVRICGSTAHFDEGFEEKQP